MLLAVATVFIIGCTPKLKQLEKKLADVKLVKIAEDDAYLGPCEPSIAIRPGKENEILVGSILDRIHTSKDGGKTWKNTKLTSPYGVYGDPVVGIDGDGRYYYAHLSNPDGTPYQGEAFLDRIVVQTSENGGKSWSDGSFPENDMSKDQDKHWFYLDPSGDRILMTWTEFDEYGSKDPDDASRILFSQSTDQAKTWSEPISISFYEGNCIDDDQTTEGALPVIDNDGNYHVVWAYDEALYLNTSTDDGKTWMKKERKIATQPGGWSYQIPGVTRCNGMPVLKVDRSSTDFSGNLYVNWSDQRNGEDDTDIWFTKSTDGGKNWSTPLRVNDDPAGSHQFLTWMDVDPVTGYIYIVFYDRRNYNDHKTDVYLAYSIDGGETFVNKRLSEEPFTPSPMVFFGDYNNISAYNNKVRPVWTEFKNGKLSIWTALLNME